MDCDKLKAIGDLDVKKLSTMVIGEMDPKKLTLLKDFDVYTCKICNKSIIADLESITIHKNVHKIKWEEYIEYGRSMMKGVPPKELPQIDVYTCKICNTSVKYVEENLKSTH